MSHLIVHFKPGRQNAIHQLLLTYSLPTYLLVPSRYPTTSIQTTFPFFLQSNLFTLTTNHPVITSFVGNRLPSNRKELEQGLIRSLTCQSWHRYANGDLLGVFPAGRCLLASREQETSKRICSRGYRQEERLLRFRGAFKKISYRQSLGTGVDVENVSLIQVRMPLLRTMPSHLEAPSELDVEAGRGALIFLSHPDLQVVRQKEWNRLLRDSVYLTLSIRWY